jgi:uncharacterized protein VirK/YbjX
MFTRSSLWPPHATAGKSADALEWPSASGMFAGAWELDWQRRVKYLARQAVTVAARRRVLAECLHNEFARMLLRSQPRAFYPLMSHLLDRRFGVHDRLDATLASLRAVPRLLAPAPLEDIAHGLVPLLALDDGSRLTLSLSGVSFHEGLLQVGLQSPGGERLYSIGFGFRADHLILMGNVQGPSIGRGSLDDNRQLTHAAHGLRPPYLLLRALRSLAAAWGVSGLTGIDPDNHVKGRWNLRDSRLKFDYRAFWSENGGCRSGLGNWALPLVLPTRELSDVPSRRRAMYRRRYEMLDRLDDTVRHITR